ncbi:MAG: N-6 DNA methylase [Oscillospiraceae bacterium]|nr:N-6 DNA methylase [Oscillospiraceae bacterium]
MPRFSKVNNERSEAIELIKLMDSIVKRNTWQIKSIGGESTLNTGKERMFPDVFVCGDTARTQVLQGWEIKMPDVSITDSAFIADAQRKADVLGVNSCIIWNFAYGVLYVKNDEAWVKAREWDKTNHIRTRGDVVTYRADWETLISEILSEINGFFVSGELRPAKIGDIITDTVLTELIRRNKVITSEHIFAMSVKNTVIASHVSHWWRSVEKEYKFDGTDKFSVYAKFVLLNWINKLTFAHMIKGNHNPAVVVETVNEDMSPADALRVFEEITDKCDFFNIFEAVPYGELLPNAAWTDLTDYNAFLSENGLDQMPQTALQSVLENSVNQFKRSVAGVFTTPPKLAEILVKSGVIDLTAPTIDPCCGTGTIAKEILDVKEPAIGIEAAFATTYAADKFTFPLQVSNLAMTRATAMNLPSLLFRSNAFDLYENKEVEITDPQNGERKIYQLPKWGSIVSNLPFVAFDQEGREESKRIAATIERVYSEIGMSLSRRADLYQAILLYLYEGLADGASVAVVTSNSWLGTLAGQNFFKVLNHYYTVESIIANGNGKWFNNADVVTVMLFMKKKQTPQHAAANHKIHFGLIHKVLAEISDEDTAQIIDSIKLKAAIVPELLSFRQYTLEKIEKLLQMNIALNSFFYDIDWLSDFREILCPVTEFFEVFRGMKTGQDEIYYLRNKNDVDSDYIERVFKSAKDCKYLIAQADTPAFVCDKTIEELSALGHQKTLDWIDRYQGHINQSVPNKNVFWQNLSDGKLSGSHKIRLFTGMNPERRIFYGLLDEPAQINQRAIGFNPLSKTVDLALCHALFNSIIGIFYAEATGFPKGLGALDNRAENTKKILMLDPRRLSKSDSEKILKAFKPLLGRKIMTTAQEYQQKDRLVFEKAVADCFGYSKQFERIKNSVLEMQKVRLSVRDSQIIQKQ